MKIDASHLFMQSQHKRETLSSSLSSATVNSETPTSETAIESTESVGTGVQLTIHRNDNQSLKSSSTVTDANNAIMTQFASQVISQSVSDYLFTSGVFAIGQNVTDTGETTGIAEGIFLQSLSMLETEESVNYSVDGMVSLADGRTVQFALEFDFERQTQLQYLRQTKIEPGQLIDPLMMSIDGGPITLSDEIFEFDLNADGEKESISQTGSGTGYLVFDKNQNGIIDDGREMFGPQSGFGWQELAAYDDDGNGWIDENDAIFNELGFLGFDADGVMQQQSLAEVGIGAISLAHEETIYQLFNSDGELQAQAKSSGVALKDNGDVAFVQEMDMRDFSINNSSTLPLMIETTITLENAEPTRLAMSTSSFGVLETFENMTTRNEAMQQEYIDNMRSSALERMLSTVKTAEYFQQQTPDVINIKEAEGFRFLDNLPDRYKSYSNSIEEKSAELHMLIKSLKDIREQQKEGLKKLNIYSLVQGIT